MYMLRLQSISEEAISKEAIRILPEHQDRTKKILSTITGNNIEIYNIDRDFNITSGKLKAGSFGEIIRATIKKTGQSIILKRFQKFSKSQQMITDDIIREIAFLQLLNKYPQTKAVTLYGVALNTMMTQMYIVLERLEKSLYDMSSFKLLSKINTDTSDRDDSSDDNDDNHDGDRSESDRSPHITVKPEDIQIRKRLLSQQLKIIFYKIIKSFSYIHGLGILHNDIKLGNLMINNNDIRIIDFGISEFLSVGPSKELVSDYMCTEITKAPDSEDQEAFGYLPTNRKSYASDMYSIGCTIVHLATDNKNKKVICNNNKIYSSNYETDISAFLMDENVLGQLGYDLLLKIMEHDTHLRWCANEALSHNYFQGISVDTHIDRSLIFGGDINKLYNNQVQYTKGEYDLHQMEICFLEIQHQTFMDNIIQMKSLPKHTQQPYFVVMDWIFGDVFFRTNIIDGFDTFINNLCFINNTWEHVFSRYGPRKELQMLGLLPNHIYRSIFNYSMKHIEFYCQLSDYSFSSVEAFNFLLNDLLIERKFDIPIYPISLHIQYIYLKLKYSLSEMPFQSEEIFKKIYINICIHITFWLMQPERYDENISIWEIIIFCTNRTLSLILDINLFELNEHPFLNFLTLEDNKCLNINRYFQSRFNNEILNSNPTKYENLFKILYTQLNPLDKQPLFTKK